MSGRIGHGLLWGAIGEPGVDPRFEQTGQVEKAVVPPRPGVQQPGVVARPDRLLGDGVLGAGERPVGVKLRSAAPVVAARLRALADGRAAVALEVPQAGVAPGQACVFYDGDRVLGGGWIERPETARSAEHQAA